MAVKKYVSILELLKPISEALKDKERNIVMIAPERVGREEENIGEPLFLFEERQRTAEPEEDFGAEPHPLERHRRQMSQAVQEEGASPREENATQIVRTNWKVWETVHSMPQEKTYEFPHILELEFLKESDFELGEDEWDLINQMMLAQLGIWYKICICESLVYETSVAILTALAKAGFLHELDLEENPDAVEEIIKKAYEPFAGNAMKTSPKAYRGRHIHNWIAEPLSSLDAFEILDDIEEELSAIDRSAIYSRCLLFLPFIMVYSILERDTEAVSGMSWYSFQNYKDSMPELSDDVDNDFHEFSYGYAICCHSYSVRERLSEMDDKDFVGKILSHIIMRLKEILEDRVMAVSVSTLTGNKNIEGLKKVVVRLDEDHLVWEEEK